MAITRAKESNRSGVPQNKIVSQQGIICMEYVGTPLLNKIAKDSRNFTLDPQLSLHISHLLYIYINIESVYNSY